MRRILLVRHGETEFNRARRIQGHLDVPLNESGRAQARAIGQRLAGEQIAYCVSSDLSRAADTAREIVRHHDLDLVLTPDLREAHLGELQSRYLHELDLLPPELTSYRRLRDTRAKPPGGESLLDVRRRAQRVARGLAKSDRSLPPGDFLVVGHGGSLRALLTVLLGLPCLAARSFRFENCGLTAVDWDPSGHATLLAYNDCAHLAG